MSIDEMRRELRERYELLARIHSSTGGQDYVPGTDIRIEWSEYNRFAQERVFMKPLDFLALCAPPLFGKTKEHPFGFYEPSVRDIDQAICSGEPLWALFLDVDISKNMVVGHEGRHRAYWAWKKGLKLVPVMIFHRRDRGYVEAKPPIDLSKVKSQAELWGFPVSAKEVALFEGLKNSREVEAYKRG